MELSVVIPWRDRPELGQTLESNSRRLRGNGVEVLVVNYGGDGQTLDEILHGGGWSGIRVVEIPATGTFNKAECLNAGVSYSRGGRILLLDADVTLTSDFLERALAETRRARCFASVAKVVESAPEKASGRWDASSEILHKVHTSELTARNGRRATIEFATGSMGTRTGPGLMVVRKADYVAVQGFNSSLQGWGFEDFDLQIRLQLALGLDRRTFGEVHHLSHESKAPGDSNTRNKRLCYRNYDRGLFLGTYDADVLRWRDRTVETLI